MPFGMCALGFFPSASPRETGLKCGRSERAVKVLTPLLDEEERERGQET